MQLCISPAQEVCNDIRSLPFWMLLLIRKTGVFLITLGREADVVKLDFICAALGRRQRQSDVIFLNLYLRRVGPHKLAVLAPRLPGFLRFDRQFGMSHYQALVAEH